MSTIAPFPTPETTGIPYGRYDKPEPDFEKIVYENTYADGGKSFNVVNSRAPQRWLIEFDGLQEDEADIWSNHYALALHSANDFPFTEVNGLLNTGVRYSKFQRRGHESGNWVKLTIELIKYP